jgi:hypothetical protein
MPGWRGTGGYAGVAGADLENAPQGPVPFTSPFGLPVTKMRTWYAGGSQAGANTGGVPGTPVQRASGNPAVETVQTWLKKSPYGGGQTGHIEGNPRGQLPYGYGQNPEEYVSGIPQFGWPRPLNPEQESATPRPGRPVGGANDKLWTADRHGILKVGYENSGRNSGETDPPMDGPARPSLWLVQRTINYQQGTDTTLTQDDLSRDYSRVGVVDEGAQSIGWVRSPLAGPVNGYMGREGHLYAGEQGVGWAPVYGGTPGMYQEYGSYAGVSPTSPGVSEGIHSPVPQGTPGDGQQKIWSGPPHGLHSPTLPTYSQTIGRYMDIPQMHAPRIDRPSNSPIAGQSYSQTVQAQGETGSVPQGVGLNAGVNFNQRVRGNGWRGRASG